MNEAIKNVVMPKWGLSMTSGKIIDWLASVGDEIGDGDELADIDTDKIAGTLESSNSGVLRTIIAQAGEDVPVGATIALIAPTDVADQEITEVAKQAREDLETGAVEEISGPVTNSVRVLGRTLSYATLGSGDETVVLVHGYGGDKNSWLFVQEPLSAERTVHALDLPGHGESSKDVGDGSVQTLASTVSGFLSELGIERAHLVGHSLGGAVVTALAATEPAKVASLTLIAPAGFGEAIDAEYLRGFANASSRRELKPHLGKLFADPALATRQLADDLMKFKRMDGVDEALQTLLGTLLDGDSPGIDAAPLLAQVRAPLAVVWGRGDQVLPADNAAALAERTEVRYVDEAGHMVHMEKPNSVVAAVQHVTTG